MGALGRFEREPAANGKPSGNGNVEDEGIYYRVPHPGILWNGAHGVPLAADGGAKRQLNGTHKVKDRLVETKKAGEGKSGRRVAAAAR